MERIGPDAVTGFVLEMSQLYAIASMKPLTSCLRSLLRFLFASGDIGRDLSPVVPSVAGWQLAGLPRGADEEAVAALLASCDRSTALGRRDFTVLMLMSRLGLRAVEIARLCLEDIDWRGAELTVHGKGGRIDRMPLPSDVGAALADWPCHGRRPSTFREVFTRVLGPVAPLQRNSIVTVPRRASARAGIAVIGAHRLRHRVACRVLAGGGSLAEVAEVLRHNDHASSAIYAKVDLAALAAVVRPWTFGIRTRSCTTAPSCMAWPGTPPIWLADQAAGGHGTSPRGAQPRGGSEQRHNIGVGIQERHHPAGPVRQQTRWRDLDVRVALVQIVGGAAHDAQPEPVPTRAAMPPAGSVAQDSAAATVIVSWSWASSQFRNWFSSFSSRTRTNPSARRSRK